MNSGEKPVIKETIVVEGKDDISAVKAAVNANVIATSGLGLNAEIMELIKQAAKRSGIIVMTDSDFAGEKIRKKIEKICSEYTVKHAFVPKSQSLKDNDIGVENAAPEAIISALEKVKTKRDFKDIYTNNDMIYYGLIGNDNSSKLRDEVGSELGIGYANGKQFLNRLNAFGIEKTELELAISKVISEEKH